MAVFSAFIGQSQGLLSDTAELGLEGVIAERLDAAYREGRATTWLKIKHRRRQRLIVTGWRGSATVSRKLSPVGA